MKVEKRGRGGKEEGWKSRPRAMGSGQTRSVVLDNDSRDAALSSAGSVLF